LSLQHYCAMQHFLHIMQTSRTGIASKILIRFEELK
jgi:hypothetical protein